MLLLLVILVVLAFVIRHLFRKKPRISVNAWNWHQSGKKFKSEVCEGSEIFFHDSQARCPTSPKGTILLIHGFPTSSYDWRFIWKDLAKECATYCPAPALYNIASTQATIHEELLRELGVSSCHVLAHDYGDTVAQELLARMQAGVLSFSISSVCFLNGGMIPRLHRPRPVQTLLAHPTYGPWVAAFMPYFAFKRGYMQVFGSNKPTEGEIRDDFALICFNDGLPVMANLISYMAERKQHAARWEGALSSELPMLALIGPADPVSGEHVIGDLTAAIEGGGSAERKRVVTLPSHVGHYPQVEAPELVLEHYLEFLDAF